MAASISMAGSMSTMESWPSSNTKLIKLNTKLVVRKILAHVRPNIAKARQLAQHAMKLKKMLLTSGCACQWIKAGACQKSVDSGKYSNKQNNKA